MPTPKLDPAIAKEARRLKLESGYSNAEIAKRLNISTGAASNATTEITSAQRKQIKEKIIQAVRDGLTLAQIKRKYRAGAEYVRRTIAQMPFGNAAQADATEEFKVDESILPPLPGSDARDLPLFTIDGPGTWGIIGDIHIPYHHKPTIERFVEECRRRNVKGILLNGDTLDSHEVAFFDVHRDAKTYRQELETCQQFLAYLRARFPKTRIVWKDGNHEERVGRYCLRRAPAISDLPCVNLPQFLNMQNYGLEYVTDQRIIMLGHLPVLHGHEYKGGISTPVNAARGVFLKAKDSVIINHFHQTSMHPEMTIKGKEIVTWSIGCACGLQPRYNPHGGKWNHGYALIELDRDGGFAVDNRRVLRTGKVA